MAERNIRAEFGVKYGFVLGTDRPFYGITDTEMRPEKNIAPDPAAEGDIQTNESLAEGATGISSDPSLIRQRSPLVTVDDNQSENPYDR